MIKFVKQLWNDRSGNALLITGAALPVVIGAAGLATDTVQWVLWSRQLQRAADSAAFAGVYAKGMGDDPATAVTTDLGNNNQTLKQSGVSLKSGYPVVSFPTSATNAWTNGVKVRLSVQKSLSFSSLFMTTAPSITVSATAALVDTGVYCAKGLKRSGGAGIKVGGSASVNLGCRAHSNSSSSPSVDTNGSNYNITSPEVVGVGTMPGSMNGVTKVTPYGMALPDNLAGKYSTSVPADANCKNDSQNEWTEKIGSGKDAVTKTHLYSYETGKRCYNSFKLTGGDYYLDAGTYYLNSTDFDVTGGSNLYGTNVTIILTGTTPGSLKMNGNAIISLTAPTDTSSSYYKMLFIQAPNATLENNNVIQGDSGSLFDGGFYFPSGQLSFTGNNATSTKCVMAIGYVLNFTGNTNLQNDTTGCTANNTVSGQMIKLVA